MLVIEAVRGQWDGLARRERSDLRWFVVSLLGPTAERGEEVKKTPSAVSGQDEAKLWTEVRAVVGRERLGVGSGLALEQLDWRSEREGSCGGNSGRAEVRFEVRRSRIAGRYPIVIRTLRQVLYSETRHYYCCR